MMVQKRARSSALWMIWLLLFLSTHVMASNVPDGTVIRNVASVTYAPNGYTQTQTVSSNAADAVVQLPSLTIVKSVTSKAVSEGIYDLDYTIRVTNSSAVEATNVRVIDNLNCTFNMDLPGGQVASWQLLGGVNTANGYLVPSSQFTGNVPCDRAKLASSDPAQVPTDTALSLVDGTRSLAPGQSETITFTVRMTEKSSAYGTRVSVTNKAWLAAFSQNSASASASDVVAASATSAQATLLDPQGTVYDAVTRLPIAGAVVTVTRQSCSSGGAGAIQASELLNGNSGVYTYNANGSVSMTTGADGAWQFYVASTPAAGMCTYAVAVTPPAGSRYVFPSQRIPATSGSFTSCGAIVPNATPPQASDPTNYYLSYASGFNPDGSACDATHDHIPLDQGSLTGLILSKDASKQEVEFGDFIDYALTISNKSGAPLTGVTFTDTLPQGFAYVSRSSRLNNAAVDNPQGGAGPRLVWSFPTLRLPAGQSAVVRYRVRVGVGARISGMAVNRAAASSSSLQSNPASFGVRVTGGVFSDEAFAFGKVYMDCKRDRMQSGADEPGVPGVRLWLEDGTSVVTDSEGKWSLYGLRPQTHVLRLDETTLPRGATIELLDNRNAKNPASRFLDLKNGELHKGDFPLLGCDLPDTMQDVTARRERVAKRGDLDGEAMVSARLSPTDQAAPRPDTRSLPATGQISGVDASVTAATTAPAAGPLIAMPATPAGDTNSFINGSASVNASGTLGLAQQSNMTPARAMPDGATSLPAGGAAASLGTMGPPTINRSGGKLAPWSQALQPQGAGSEIELERAMAGLDRSPDFMDLKDHDTVASLSINVRVKGPIGTQLRLTVNGTPIDRRQIGKQVTLPQTGVTAREYIGVVLKPGENVLRLDVVDEAGTQRGESRQITVMAPARLGTIQVEVPPDARADLRTLIPITVRLTDAAGAPITARTPVTLETDAGHWQEDDLNPHEPGLQAYIEAGQATFHLISPGKPGDVHVRVSTPVFTREAVLSLRPDLRPMIAVGIVEGTLDLSRRGKLSVGQIPAGAAFEQELNAIGNGDSDKRVGGRAAFFLKGAIKGEYLLTAALDTGKSSQQSLFRDIRPDEFYPIYGDSSASGFDAQSTQHLYVRIDKNRSYLLYGDFTTASSTEVRMLSQTNRTLTGIKDVYQSDGMRITSYGAHTAQTQEVEEFPARGISGPYYLAGSGDLAVGSEQVDILVRDRNQPNLILQRTPAIRFVDYTIEPLSKRILFTHAIASVDANLNPQSIRVTYEVDSGGPKYVVAGTDAQFKVTNNLQLGVVLNTDRDPQNRRDLQAVTALARVGEHTSVAAEAVHTDTDLHGIGNAERVELRHQGEKLGVTAQVIHAGTNFDNPGSGYSAGHTEANAHAEYRIDPSMTARTEVLYSKDMSTEGSTHGATMGLQKRFNDLLSGELGLRYGTTTSSSTASIFNYGQVSSYSSIFGASQAGSAITNLGNAFNTIDGSENNLTTIRSRLTANVPHVPQAQVFVEGEQDLHDDSKHMAAVGGNYAVTDKTRLYGRYEFVSSLYEVDSVQTTRNTGIFGVESNYMNGGRVYNEYRLADSLGGRAAEAATGIRNTFKLSDHWRLTGGVERTEAIGHTTADDAVDGFGNATAVISGVEYSNDRVRGSGVLEGRHGSDANTVLGSFGFAAKLNQDWSLLARAVDSSSKGNGVQQGNERALTREQIGMAYRPVNQDVWNVLARYEHKTEKIRGDLTTSGAISGNVFGSDGSLPGDYEAHIVSVHVNVNPQPGDYINGRLAAKVATQSDSFLKSTYAAQLLYGRWTHDLSQKWDVGVQAGLLHGSGGSFQKSAGVELGYLMIRDLWFSVGYNFIGLSDRDLTAGEYTNQGIYARLRYKFDETSLGFKPTGAANAQPVSAPAVAVVPPEKKELPTTTILQSEVLFDFDKSEIKQEGKAALDALAERLKTVDCDVVLIMGHTDSVGSEAYNQELSERRAQAVSDYLVAKGLDATRVKVEGRGMKQPIASNDTPEGRAKNRRVVIEIMGTEKQ